MWSYVSLWLCLLAASCLLGPADPRRPEHSIRIAGVFEEWDLPEKRLAFLSAVQAINRQTAVDCVRDCQDRPLLTAEVLTIATLDSFGTGRKVCSLAAEGVAGIVGPRQSPCTDIVRSVCDRLEIPQIVTNWDPTPPPSRLYQFNLHPDAEFISQALVDVLHELKWRSYTVLYEGDESLVRLRGILQERGPADPPIAVRQLSPDGDHRLLLKAIKESSESRLVLDCETDMVLSVLHQAAELRLAEVYQSYLISSLDVHTLDLNQFRLSGANITTLRLIQPNSDIVMKTVEDLQYTDQFKTKVPESLTPQKLRVEAALVFDSVHVLAEALFKSSTIDRVETKPLNCTNETDVWDFGVSVKEFIRDMRHEGLSGHIMFDAESRRVGFKLEVIELSSFGFHRVGNWTPEDGFMNSRGDTQSHEEMTSVIQGRNLIVSSRLGAPYLSEKKATTPPRVGNDRFEGYSMDLISQIAKMLNFTFEFKLAPDGAYGKFDEVTGHWTGLVGELIAGRADLALCDLTITQERQSVVDFTMPFMNLGISILYRKLQKEDPNLFTFIDPFTIDVWIYMATAFLGISLIFFISARMAPSEWNKGHPCDPDPSELENTFSLINILWFTMGSLMCQGCDLLPKAMSTRMIAAMWWFFTLIIMSASYTANLAAFLTAGRMESPINGVQDLAKQSKIKYGLYRGGSTEAFFRSSNDTLYSRMYLMMKQARPDVFTDGNAEGVDRVIKEKGKYAFFMESTSIEYQTALNCNLRKVGGLLDSKGYGIALQRDSPFRTDVSGAVLTLQERGELDLLKAKWWKAPEGKECPAEKVAVDNNELGIQNVGGVFLVLAFGMIAAFICAVLELLWKCRAIAVEEKITPCEALRSELKFALQFSNEEKPVRKANNAGDEESASQLSYGALKDEQ